ncbi:MAG TPA: hypothetical protein VJ987_12875 [Anaerolineales bacterium]|nr:hypothetical protein [Anaerolineales bacterium]
MGIVNGSSHFAISGTNERPPRVFLYIVPMSELQGQFATSIAAEAVELLEDHLLSPGGHLLPLSARGGGVPGMSDHPWSRLNADVFFPNLPVMYSLALRRELPDALRGSLRARRILFEGFMMAECSADHAIGRMCEIAI